MASVYSTSSLDSPEKNHAVNDVQSDGEKNKSHYAVENVDSFSDAMLSEEDLEMVFSHFDDRPFEEWLQILRDALKVHRGDVSLGSTRFNLLSELVEGSMPGQSDLEWQNAVRFEAFLFHEWSPYPEVRAVTRPPVLEDDPTEEYQTFRSMAVGIVYGAAGAVIATFFSPRSPSITISSNSLQIVIAITGYLLSKLPRIQMPLGFGRKFVINTGTSWSFREQMLATLSMAVVDGNPYVQSTIIAQGNKYFYHHKDANDFGYIILLVLSTSFMGFGVCNFFRASVILPVKRVYYQVLPTIALSRTLVQADIRESVNGWRLKRWEFFMIVSTIFFGWYWITAILMNFLSYFTWMCYAAPNHVNVNAITGNYSGFGFNPVFNSFDPSIFNPFSGIAVPAWAYTNKMAGMFIAMIACVIMWWTNVAHTSHFPINSNLLYDNQGNEWDVSSVLDPETLQLDQAKYQQYSLPYWATGNVAGYGAFFMIYTGGFLFAWLNHWREQLEGLYNVIQGIRILPGSRRPIDNFNDPFCRRLQKYKEVPEWWYLIVLLGSLGMAIGTVEGYKFSDTPVWTIFLGVGLACVFLPMVCALLAQTTFSYETNVLYELIVGYALPGNGNAILVGKAYATNFFAQAENWITNQKMAHYCGVAPRTLFWAQVTSTVVTSFVQSGIITWQMGGGIRDMCNIQNRQLFRCQGTRTYFNASVMWGVIGPRRVFKAVYPRLKWCFLIGAGYSIIFWAIRQLGPRLASKLRLKPGTWTHYIVAAEFLQYVNEVVLIVGACSPPDFSVFMDYYASLFFGLVVQKKWPRWWSKYAYLVAAGTSNGVGWAGFFNFWATEYHHIVSVDWWGNDVVAKTSDFNYTAILNPFDSTNGQYFGPEKGHFP